MPKIETNGIQIEYDTFGQSSSQCLLLIIGLGGQMIDWDENICKQLADNGHYVIRFDNRDIGLSTKFDDSGIPDVMETFSDIAQGKAVSPPYSLDDMADDATGLLDALNIKKAHICGMSMGGIIAQTIAIQHPERLLSLISIYSTTGNPELPPPKSEAMEVLITPFPKEREEYVLHFINMFKLIAGPGFPFDEKWHRELAMQRYDRSFYPQGMNRQLMAVLAHGNNKSALASVTVPTLVIHGSDDPVIPVEGGKDTAQAIPGAELLVIDGMGHDLPHGGAWLQIVDAITEHTKKAGS